MAKKTTRKREGGDDKEDEERQLKGKIRRETQMNRAARNRMTEGGGGYMRAKVE